MATSVIASYLDHDIPQLISILEQRTHGHVHVELCTMSTTTGQGVGQLWITVHEWGTLADSDVMEARTYPIATFAPELLGAVIHASLALWLLEDDQKLPHRPT